MSIKTDGRDINTELGILTGEGAQQRASGSADPHELAKAQVWDRLPEPDLHDPTYYDRPLLQKSVWTWAIPTYYYVGGLSGASMALGGALQLANFDRNDRVIEQSHLIGTVGAMVSGVLLVYDLGRPARFLNMLRVFRPTSPMNVGAWILSGAGGAVSAALVLHRTPFGKPFGLMAAFFGLGLCTYTGVLVGNTAVPLWSGSRLALPLLFGASAMAATGSAFDIIGSTSATRMFGNIGRVCELAAAFAMEKEAARVEYVARPLHQGFSGFLWKSASILTGASLVLSLFARSNRNMRIAAGVLGTLGSLTTRFAVEHAGNRSARDPRSSFRQQRQQGPS